MTASTNSTELPPEFATVTAEHTAGARNAIAGPPTSGRAPRRALMISFHVPPCRGSSGLQRTLSFCRYLPENGWAPVVLSANPRCYTDRGADQLADIPASVPVHRAFGLDTARHLSLAGRYPSWMALPDRWISWYLGAVPAGLRLIRRYRPEVLWSTYPLSTAHLIGLTLHRLTGIPWVADFRDPMTEVDAITGKNHPGDPSLWRVRRWIESHTVRACTRAVLVTPGSLRIHAERYADLPASRWSVISNGFDEHTFAGSEHIRPPENQNRPLMLLHSGVLYPTPDRDPGALFAALAKLRAEGRISKDTVKIVLRATGHDARYRQQIRELGIEDLVSLEPQIGYREALAEMLSADGLLLFQGYTSNPAVPAKLYEYLRAKHPIFALVHHEGDTAATLRQAGVGRIVPLDNSEKIAAEFPSFLEGLRRQSEPVATEAEIYRHSRRAKSAELASLFNAVLAHSPVSARAKVESASQC
ncbi:MAG TPA: glycosyltransferase [Candidatus Acidoferrales bacterium]|nr:glycosyltransferase [Candidatus Acidoferrales bacterium]